MAATSDRRRSPFGRKQTYKPTQPSKTGRPPRIRKPTTLPEGPRLYSKKAQHVIGFGPPPPGFVTATTSASEWKVYAAIAEYFHDPVDPRQPPFFGGRGGEWSYQKAYGGGRRGPGGAVADYVIYMPNYPIIIRLQTYRYHTAADAEKQAYDALQLYLLEGIGRVADIYEQDFIGDATDQAVVILVKNLLSGTSEQNPINAGTVFAVRPGI